MPNCRHRDESLPAVPPYLQITLYELLPLSSDTLWNAFLICSYPSFHHPRFAFMNGDKYYFPSPCNILIELYSKFTAMSSSPR